MKDFQSKSVQTTLATLLVMVPFGSFAQSAAEYELSSQLNVLLSSGKPTNDVPGFGFSVHRKLSDDWYLNVNLSHSPEFDFERTSRVVGISTAPGVGDIDAIGSMLTLTVAGERRFALESEGWTGFWNLGAGFNEIDMDDVDGPRSGGGTYDIETDIDTEFVIVGGAGLMQRVSKNWSARYELTAEHHSGDWDLRDKISGSTGSIGDYMLYGLRLGMNYRF